MKRAYLFLLITTLLLCAIILAGCSPSGDGGLLNANQTENADQGDQVPEQADETIGSNEPDEKEVQIVYVHCGAKKLQIDLADNPSAKAFAEKLKQGDVTVIMNDYGNFEKVGDLGFSLVQSNTQITTSPGDVILYLGNNITIYYDTNSWNFTLLGKIKNMTRDTMLAFFGGKGEVTVTFSIR